MWEGDRMKTISGIEFASEHNGTDVFRLIELAYEQGQKDGHSEQLSTNLAGVGTDLISRQAAITQLSHNKNKGDDEWELAVENDIQTIWKLPSARPKRGKWIDRGEHGDWEWQADGRGKHWHEWECNICHHYFDERTFFCPHCGADMRGEQYG
jgi:hypothetical protein